MARRLALPSLAAALILALAAASQAGAARWEPIRWKAQGIPSAAARDGARTLLVARVDGRIVVTTLTAGRARATTVARDVRLRSGGDPIVLTTAQGSAVALWEDVADGGVQVRASLRGSRDSRWTAPRTVSSYPAAGFGRVLSAAAGPDGTVLVAWWGGPAGGRLGIHARTWRLGRGWSAAEEVSAGGYPAVAGPPPFVAVGAAVGPRGDMAVTWQEPLPFPDARRRLALRPAGGGWQEPVTLAEGRLGQASARLPIAVAGDGRAVSPWLEVPEAGADGVAARTCLHAAVAGAGAVERAELRCVAGAGFGRLQAAADPGGNLMVAWQVGRFGPLRAEVQLAARPAESPGWIVPAPLVGDRVGFVDPRGLQPAGGGRFLATLTTGEAVPGHPLGVVRVQTVDAAAARVGRPLGRPALPGRRRDTDLGFLPFPDAPGGVLTWLDGERVPHRSRLALLRP